MRSPVNRQRCSFGICTETNNLIKIPKEKRENILRNQRVFISEQSRFCKNHCENGLWDDCALFCSNYSVNQIEEMVDLLRNGSKETYDEPRIEINIGLTHESFDELFSLLPSLLVNLSMEKARNALKMFLNRMRTGDGYDKIAHTFFVSAGTVKKYIIIAREALLRDFVPQYIGFENLSRDLLLNGTTEMARTLYCEDDDQKLIVVADGTYIYCNKSQNYDFQRKTYNDQKKRNFVKPMVLVTTDGTYIEVYGPFEATKNDASIMQTIFQENEQAIMSVMRRNDIFLLDRGFRDCIDFLKAKGFDPKMPEFVKKNDNTGQLTTEKANKSRLVTACRFVIEARNGNIKTIWSVFNQTWNTFDLVHLMHDYRIGAALIKFFKKIISNKEDANEIAHCMLDNATKENKFSKIINQYTFQRQMKNFVLANISEIRFPQMTLTDLKHISLGTYQIENMASYCSEHIEKNGAFQIYVCLENIVSSYFGELIDTHGIDEPIVVYTAMFSRFRNKQKYNIFVLADKEKRGHKGIHAYTCDCRHGLRTVGCCSHIMSLIGYLGYFRINDGELKKKAAFIDNFFNDS